MMKKLALFLVFFLPLFALSLEKKLTVHTPEVLQGEVVRVEIVGIEQKDIKSLTVGKKIVPTFTFNNKLQALFGVDIGMTPGTMPIELVLKNNETLTNTVTVIERKKPKESFTIPENLGGTNPEAEKKVLNTLQKENATLQNMWTNPRMLWKNSFSYPTKTPIITDIYGYNRDTGTETITHKGVDFRAKVGEPIYAINRGVVRIARTFTVYGKTVVIDHGQGIQSMYMHLSKITAKPGSIVEKGTKIGESGQTGYALAPHLHLSIRLNGTSIDPLSFFKELGSGTLPEVVK